MTEEISMKNTKKEMLAAIEEMQKIIEEKQNATIDPYKEKSAKQNSNAAKMADGLSQDQLAKNISQLKTEISSELSNILDKLENEAKRYTELKKAIHAKNEELKEIYGIEKETVNLITLLETQRKIEEDFNEQFSKRKKILEEEIAETKEVWEKEKETSLLEREREEEEYDYKIKRQREKESNDYLDKLDKLKKELADKKISFDSNIAEKEKELSDREDTLLKQEELLVDLQNQVNDFPAILENETKKAAEQIEKTLKITYAQEKSIQEKEFEGEKRVFETKIFALELQVKEQAKQIEKLSLQQEKAYEQVKDIANRAVSGASEKLDRMSISLSRPKED